VDEEELRNVFNLGIGFCAVVPADQIGGELVIGEIR
jgi:phosphoribosylaminoimidazole (AIR) synthetase